MHNILSIAKYELKIQLKNTILWIIWAISLAFALFDNYPSEANLGRLEFLTDQGYVVSRLLSQGGILLLFGLTFILSDRIRGDQRKGTMELFLASPLSKAQYIFGKLMGNCGTALTVMAAFLSVSAIVQLLSNPGPFRLLPYVVGFVAMCLPACFFISACSIALPVMIDIRLFYVMFSVYFMINTGLIYTEDPILRTLFLFQRDMLKLIFTFEHFEIIDTHKLLWNLLFLLGTGFGSILVLYKSKRYWREKV